MDRSDTVADRVFRRINDAGVEYLFTVPGGGSIQISRAAARNSKITQVLCKHEQGAAFLAYGYALVRRGLGAALVTGGPGVTNALTGMASAWLERVPVMLLSSQTPDAALGRGAAQSGIDAVELLRPYTKFSGAIPSAKAAHLIDHAIGQALTPAWGPVYLAMAPDVAQQAVDMQPAASSRWPGAECRPVDRAAMLRVVEAVRKAKRCVIVAGFGAYLSGAEEVLRRLVVVHGIDVVTTPRTKGLVPENLLGVAGVWGHFGTASALDLILNHDSDVRIVVGSRLGEASSNGWHPALARAETFFHIDVDPTVPGRNYPTAIPVCADAKAALELLAAELDRAGRKTSGARVRFANGSEPAEKKEAGCTRNGLTPHQIRRAMQAGTPRDALMFCDIGEASMCNLVGGFQTSGQRVFIGLPFGSMGTSIAAIGGKLAAPERPVIAAMGDGAFLMVGMELHTAIEYGISLDVVVFDNGGHLMVKHGNDGLFPGEQPCPTLFAKRLDCAAVASGLGAQAIEIDTEHDLVPVLKDKCRGRAVRALIVKTSRSAVAHSLEARLDALRHYFGKPAKSSPARAPVEA